MSAKILKLSLVFGSLSLSTPFVSAEPFEVKIMEMEQDISGQVDETKGKIESGYPLSGLIRYRERAYPLKTNPKKDGDLSESAAAIFVEKVFCTPYESYLKTHDPKEGAPYMAGYFLGLWEAGKVGDEVPFPYLNRALFTNDGEYTAAVRESEALCKRMRRFQLGEHIRPLDRWDYNLIRSGQRSAWDIEWHSEFVGYIDPSGTRHLLQRYIDARDRLLANSTAPSSYYEACGCGCCGGTEPAPQCLYHSKGDSLEDVIVKDRADAKSPACRSLGCRIGTKYSYCD